MNNIKNTNEAPTTEVGQVTNGTKLVRKSKPNMAITHDARHGIELYAKCE